ncbi:methyltransferase [Aliiglaciecola sp. CAU 1673]|uniref:methyltransferase n=1 Tax=Aliiglaciecola sp. CAU 1673 TaxID=3032595 RepID=UPI0023D9C4DA|nr:methyltransferase [Aliiglaciecola sp. CAU 1673]MDF2179110.1 methyltransferase [Aliiglaciecola sp. CAU 1673]
MLSPASQLLVRNQERFSEGRWLLVNPQDSAVFSALSGDLYGYHQYFDIYQQASRIKAKHHHFGAEYPQSEKFDGICIYMPKAKEQAEMLLANLVHCLLPGGQILLVGDNKGGVKSSPKLMAPYAEHCNKVDSARHCALYGAIPDKAAKAFKLESWIKQFKLQVAGVDITLCSLPGVFSHGSLDLGTKLLLEQIKEVPNGPVLDFGCGAGIIGCYLGLMNPKAKPLMVDVSALAIFSASQSAKANGLEAEALPSNGLSEVKGSFAGVYTNPPFHTGLNTDYQVTADFCKQIRPLLRPNGPLYMVANSFLRYQPLLEQSLGAVEILLDGTKFRVYRCHRLR